MKYAIGIITLIVVAVVIGGVVISKRSRPVIAPVAVQTQPPAADTPRPAGEPQPVAAPVDAQVDAPSPVPVAARPLGGANRNAVNKPRIAQDAGSNEPQVSEPLARAALDYVGQDPYAEAIWETAINDANQPPDARQNLIEDLNENGLSDPNNPTINDLPLIQSRIALIEQIGPGAMDDVNDAAFHEAYKDLVNMEAKLTGR